MYKLLPQYSISNNSLFLFDKIINKAPYKNLKDLSKTKIKKLIKKRIIYSDRKLVSNKNNNIILAPHSDDFCFSLGGTILSNPSFQVWNFFSYDADFTIDTNLTEDSRVHYRKKEESLIAELLGIKLIFFNYPSEFHRGYKYWNEVSDIKKDSLYIEKIKELLKKSKKDIYCPLGIGNHIDHTLIRNVVIELLLNKQLDKSKVKFYEDLPYADKYDINDPVNLIKNKIGPLYPEINDISDVIKIKIYLCSLYLTQITKKSLDHIYNHSKKYLFGKFSECIWKLK